MADLFEKFKELVAPSRIKTDSYTAPLFYKVSFGICLTSFIILFGNQYFGEPIVCIANVDNKDERIEFLENHCWMHGTTRIKNLEIKKNSPCDYDPVTVDTPLTYYPWVPFILLLNAIVFRLPHTIWRLLEGGYIEKFQSEKANQIYLEGKDENEEFLEENSQRFKNIKQYLKWYHAKFVFVQFLNFVAVIVLIIIDNAFLQNNFLHYGTDWKHCDVFPTQTNCDLIAGDTSFKPKTTNGLCHLNQNFASQYIFLIMWYWFIFLIIIGLLQLVFETVCIFSPPFRAWILRQKLPSEKRVKRLKKFTSGQWLLLFQISRNMDQDFFYEFLKRIPNVTDEIGPEGGQNGEETILMNRLPAL